MLRLEDPIYLWLLLIIPVLVLIRFVGWRRRKMKFRRLGDPQLIKELMPDISCYRPTLKFVLQLVAIALLIVVLARPQMGTKTTHDKRKGIEAIIALDISNSMLAQDVAPSRLDKSKLLIENLVDKFTNDKIGLIVFAGEAYVQLPITSDDVSAKMFLQDITPGLIQTQGTDIAGAIELATQAQEAAEAARKKGINVYMLGVGNTKGAPIPMEDGSYLQDNTGHTVMTFLNEDMCKEIAQAGKGSYIHVDNTSDAEKLLDEDLERLQRGETDTVIYSEY